MRFLIVEDDPHKAKRVADCLQGHEILQAQSRNVGIRILMDSEEWEINGVILDMGLPIFDDGYGYNEKNGLLILRQMERRGIKIPVLIHSGNKFDEVHEFDNVHSYILANPSVDISKQLQAFVDHVKQISA
jgi:DNA-binding response OmpR family regulator